MTSRTARMNAAYDRATATFDVAQRLRRSKAYQRFAAYLGAVKDDPLEAAHRLLESYRAFGSKRASDYARDAINQLKRDRGLE